MALLLILLGPSRYSLMVLSCLNICFCFEKMISSYMKPRFRRLKLIDEVREYNLGLWSWLWLQDNVVPKVFLTEVINIWKMFQNVLNDRSLIERIYSFSEYLFWIAWHACVLGYLFKISPSSDSSHTLHTFLFVNFWTFVSNESKSCYLLRAFHSPRGDTHF